MIFLTLDRELRGETCGVSSFANDGINDACSDDVCI